MDSVRDMAMEYLRGVACMDEGLDDLFEAEERLPRCVAEGLDGTAGLLPLTLLLPLWGLVGILGRALLNLSTEYRGFAAGFLLSSSTCSGSLPRVGGADSALL